MTVIKSYWSLLVVCPLALGVFSPIAEMAWAIEPSATTAQLQSIDIQQPLQASLADIDQEPDQILSDINYSRHHLADCPKP